MTDTSERDNRSIPSRLRDEALKLWRDSSQHGYIKVVGENSMAPLIRSGDFVLVDPGFENIHRGHIVVFNTGHGLITHRVISIINEESGPRYVTKGDSRLWPDPHFSATDIIGRVSAVKRGDRQLDLDSKSWRTLSWLIGFTMFLWVKTAGTARNLLQLDRVPIPRQVSSPLGDAVRSAFAVWLRALELIFGRWRV
jgi:hypothetical protein